ncbi:protein of unknown function [Legionella fallonii LLAP-10]|uniref:Uncharacterized protein n=1 Tax=Legionella fallonii LLAP-10 TaxID=1212491 RepID=A0A098G5J5_9GAMM|nr:protein of unknown function [Legionella fallonii LLAP-10]
MIKIKSYGKLYVNLPAITNCFPCVTRYYSESEQGEKLVEPYVEQKPLLRSAI